MSKRTNQIFIIMLCCLTSACANLSSLEKHRLNELRALGIAPKAVKKKDPWVAGGLNVLPGFGNFYLAYKTDESSQWMYGGLNLIIFGPLSIVWGPAQAAIDAHTINKKATVYYYTYDPVGVEKLRQMHPDQVAGNTNDASGNSGVTGTISVTKAGLARNTPQPIQGNHGQYMSPYTSDGVVAEWVDKALNAKMGAAIGGAAGIYAGRKAAENVPFIGGMLGRKLGDSAGRAVAIKAIGGMEYIRSTSDLSFNSVDDLAVYMTNEYGTTENFQEVLQATWEIYPELKKRYSKALSNSLGL